MPTSLKIIGTLLVVSGFIAYVGDIVGKRMGKRRGSLLGLRPRKTATVMAVATGVVIQVVSLGILTVFSQQAKQALFKFDQLREETRKIEAQAHDLKANVGNLSTQLTSTKLQLTTTRGNLAKKAAALNQKRKEIERLQALQRRLENQMELIRLRMQRVQTRYQQVRQKYQQAYTGYREARNKYLAAQNAYREARKKYQQVQDELNQKVADLDATKANLETTKKNLSEADKELADREKQLSNAERIARNYERVLNNLQKSSETLTAALEGLKQDKQSLEKEVAGLRDEQKRLLNAVTTQFGKPVIFERGEIIYSSVIEGGRPLYEIKNDLEAVVKEARKVAAARGAKGKENHPPLAIMSRYVELSDGRRIYYYEEHVINDWAESLSRQEEPFVVEVFAVINSVEGEPVDTDFRIIRNVLLFHKDDLLLKETLNGHAPTGALFRDVLSTLEKVRGLARNKGMRGGAENRYGEISYEELFEVLERIKRMNGPLTLKVRVLEDTRAAGPLRIKLEVEKMKGAVAHS